jgi:hypothetical protein
MNQRAFLLELPAGLEITQAYIVYLMSVHGLRAERGFEVDSACGSGRERIFPHHGSAPCECRLSVVRIREGDSASVSLILHSFSGRTELFLEPDPETPVSLQLSRKILQAIGCRREL